MAIWRRKLKQRVLIHSDLGVLYTCKDVQMSANANNLEISMSRRGNFHDNAEAESFFSNLKKERIKRHIYRTRNEAKADIFNYIEFFYNPKRPHGTNERRSPKQYKEIYFKDKNCLVNWGLILLLIKSCRADSLASSSNSCLDNG